MDGFKKPKLNKSYFGFIIYDCIAECSSFFIKTRWLGSLARRQINVVAHVLVRTTIQTTSYHVFDVIFNCIIYDILNYMI